MRLRCVLVDDNLDFLQAARGLLERQGVRVVGVASTIADALRQVDELRPDVTLVDVNLGDESGIELAHELANAPAATQSAVVLISTYAERDIADLIDADARVGFLSKADLSEPAISRAIELARSGRAGGGR
jgi:DNA-binding NarL/FixJ family response regulator